MSLVTRLYHRMPYGVKCLAASAASLRLKRFRYGDGSDALVAQALERDAWDAAQWSDWQQAQLATFLPRAARGVPAYRGDMGQRPDADLARLSSWPILSKHQLRADSRAYVVAPARWKGGLLIIRTSGTSGSPLTVWWTRSTAERWYALYEARIRRWNGVTRHDRWGIFGGRLVTDARRTKPPFWVWNRTLAQLYLSSYHISPASVGAYVHALRSHELRHLLGYPSALAALASLALEQGLEAPPLDVVVTNAEPLSPAQREVIATWFGCPVRDTYGMAEAVCGASECEHGGMHIWPEAGIVEVLDDNDAPVPAGTTGRLVFTGLLHDAMPLIRYEIGDRGALAPTDEACACGRGLPRFQSIEGRADDVVITPDGRRIGRLDPTFKGDMPIREAQIEQLDIDHLIVRVVPRGNFTEADEARLRTSLQERVGAMTIDIQCVERIPRGARGKLRAVISRLTP